MKTQAQTRFRLCSDSDLDSAQTQTRSDSDSSHIYSFRLCSDSYYFLSQTLSRGRLYSDSDSFQIQILFRFRFFPASESVEQLKVIFMTLIHAWRVSWRRKSLFEKAGLEPNSRGAHRPKKGPSFVKRHPGESDSGSVPTQTLWIISMSFS